MNNINEIIPHLYISNWDSSNDITKLEKNNIQAVITIDTRNKSEYILNYYKKNNINFIFLYLDDYPNQNIQKYFDVSYKFIKDHILKNKNVLVHCHAGVSRSSTLIFNYMLRTYYKNGGKRCPNCILYYFLNYARTKRSIINPNIGFINQLINYAQVNYYLKQKIE